VIVAFQGERGAFSESAIYQFFGHTVEVKPCRNHSDVFDAVDRDEADYGMVPIENSIAGSVTQNYDLFLKYDLKVCGETILKIVHCLIVNPQTTMTSIRKVYSHPQALAQCRDYLEKHNWELIPAYDTAGSVKMIKERSLMDSAAIAGEIAAEIYEMKILERDIADNRNNYTRFFVISKEDSPPTGNDKTSIIFSVAHIPGSLYRAMGEFANRGLNLTKIESRPTHQKLWEYNFYLDFEGHRCDRKCQEAIEALSKQSYFVKVLGSYPKASPVD